MIYFYRFAKEIVLKKRVIGNVDQRALKNGIRSKNIGLVMKDNLIYTCPPGCSYCVDPNTCEACLPGFTLDYNKVCIKCGPTCGGCSHFDPLKCTYCVDGTFLQKSTKLCLNCKSMCLTCDVDASNCTSCKKGYYPSAGDCISCIENCLSCHEPVLSTDPLCDTCMPGYVYNTVLKVCVKCASGCSICNPEKIFECLQCGEGF